MNFYKKPNFSYTNIACTELKRKMYSDGEPLRYSAAGSNMDS